MKALNRALHKGMSNISWQRLFNLKIQTQGLCLMAYFSAWRLRICRFMLDATHTLAQLRAGKLKGIHRLDCNGDLIRFAREIFDLADSLQVLNLSGNALTSLPDDLPRLALAGLRRQPLQRWARPGASTRSDRCG